MAGPPRETFFSRVGPQGVLEYSTDMGFGRPAFTRMWKGVGAARLHVGDFTLSEGFLVNHLVTLTLSGERVIEVKWGGSAWARAVCPRGTVAVWPARVPHSVRMHGAGEVLYVELSPELVERVVAATPGLEPLQPSLSARDEFAEHVLLALDAEARAGTTGSHRAEQLASALVGHLCERSRRRPAHPPSGGRRRSTRLHRVIDHIGAHLTDPLTLPELARIAGMDVFRFARAFKQLTGSSPHRYVLDARIARAKELLLDPALSITEVSLRTGFSTPSHFSATFRRLAQASPRAFRRRG
ncbi:MAG: AraC family transcriptional regulator [Anaeromyxobacteraceae bacterium]